MKLLFQHQHHILGFLDLALGNQIADRFRHVDTDKENINGRQGTNEEGDLPAVLRNQQIGDAGSCQPAQAPEAFQQDDKPPPQFGRCIFCHQGSCNRQLTTQAKAYQETENQQGLIVPGQGTGTSSQTV